LEPVLYIVSQRNFVVHSNTHVDLIEGHP
jgi:hypothetical protein